MSSVESVLNDYEVTCDAADREAEEFLSKIEKVMPLMKSERSMFRAGFKAGYFSASGETVELEAERGDRVFACYVAPVEKWEKSQTFQTILSAFRRGKS